jgi:hypothetical protein
MTLSKNVEIHFFSSSYALKVQDISAQGNALGQQKSCKFQGLAILFEIIFNQKKRRNNREKKSEKT